MSIPGLDGESLVLISPTRPLLWQSHLFGEDPKVSFWAPQYLTDQRDGKPTQRIESKRVSKFEGRSNSELEHYALHGWWPEDQAPRVV